MAAINRVGWILIFTLFALPLLFFPFTYLAFELPKVFLLYLSSILALYILLTSGYRLGNFRKIHYLYLVFLLWVIFTAIIGLSWRQSFLGSYFRMQGILSIICYSLLFFISGKVFENNHFRKQVSLAILVSSSVVAILAIIQFIMLWFLGNTSQLLYSNRVISTFGQPNFLGAYLVISLPFVWYLLKQVQNKRKVLIWFALVMISLGIFSTLSRSAYLGLFVLTLIWGFYHYRLLLTGIIFSVVLFAILANLFPKLVYQEWYRFQLDTINKWTAENRLEIAQKSLKLIAQKPIVGYGLENFSLAFPDVVSSKDLGLKDIVVDSSHNLFLDLGVQGGIVGLGLFLAIIASTIISGVKQIQTQDAGKKDFLGASICVVVVFLVIHQFSIVSVVPATFFWFSLGIINGSTIKQFTLQTWAKHTINFIGLMLITITILFIIQTTRAEMSFREASAYEVADINKAINLDNEAIKTAPWVEFYQVRKNFLLKQLGY